MGTSSRARDPVLEVTNFGPIVEATVDLRPLTVLVGPSNTGKSCLAILIYALHRFFGGKPRDAVARAGRSPLYDYGWYGAVENVPPLTGKVRKDIERWVSKFRKGWMAGDSPQPVEATLPEHFASWIRKPLSAGIHEFGSIMDGEIARCFGVDRSRDLIRRSGGAGGSRGAGARVVLSRYLSEASGRQPPFEYQFKIRSRKKSSLKSTIPPENPLRIEVEDPDFLPYTTRRLLQHVDDHDEVHLPGGAIAALANRIISYTAGPLSRPVHYLPADRTGVMHSHKVVVSSLVGSASRAGLRRDPPLPVLSGVLADFLETLIELGDTPRGRRGCHDDLARRLEEEILGGAVAVKPSETGYPSFHYRPDGWKSDLPLMHTSSMVSELAPVVLYLRHVVRRGDVLVIEEPESHLHPAMQVAFTRLLAAAVRSGIRIIVTTHSEWVLEALANLVRLSEVPEGKRHGLDGADLALAPQEAGAWMFEPRPELGGPWSGRSLSTRNRAPFPPAMERSPNPSTTIGRGSPIESWRGEADAVTAGAGRPGGRSRMSCVYMRKAGMRCRAGRRASALSPDRHGPCRFAGWLAVHSMRLPVHRRGSRGRGHEAVRGSAGAQEQWTRYRQGTVSARGGCPDRRALRPRDPGHPIRSRRRPRTASSQKEDQGSVQVREQCSLSEQPLPYSVDPLW